MTKRSSSSLNFSAFSRKASTSLKIAFLKYLIIQKLLSNIEILAVEEGNVHNVYLKVSSETLALASLQMIMVVDK